MHLLTSRELCIIKKTIRNVENPIPGIEVQKAITKMYSVLQPQKDQ